MKLDDPEPLLYHGESLLCDGGVVGRVTSGAYGHTLGAAVGLAFVEARARASSSAIVAAGGSRSTSPARGCRRRSARGLLRPGRERMRG